MNRRTTTIALAAVLIAVVNDHLSMVGVRLAALLNAVFDETKELPF